MDVGGLVSIELTTDQIKRFLRLPEDYPDALIPRCFREIAFGTMRPLPLDLNHPEVLAEVPLAGGGLIRFMCRSEGYSWEKIESEGYRIH